MLEHTTRLTNDIPSAHDILSIANASPEAVRRRDKERWLGLFTPDARVEDPVGAGTYVGTEQLASFWDVFIAPQRSITFLPRRDFASGDRMLRYVTISTVTPVADEPFEIPAVVEYRVRGRQIESLRAFWEPRQAVFWHAVRGVRGLLGLTRHGARTATGLGLGAALGFGRALRPEVSRRRARRLADRVAEAMTDEAAWVALTRDATVSVAPRDGEGDEAAGASVAWEHELKHAPTMRVERALVAGDHVVCVLESDARLAALALLRVSRNRLRGLDIVWARD